MLREQETHWYDLENGDRVTYTGDNVGTELERGQTYEVLFTTVDGMWFGEAENPHTERVELFKEEVDYHLRMGTFDCEFR